MSMEIYKTFTPKPLSAGELNGLQTQLLNYIRENRDMILGDDGEGTEVTPHDHEGTYGVQLSSGALADGLVVEAKIGNGAVTTAKIADGAVTTAKLAADIDMVNLTATVQRYILSGRIAKAELVYTNSTQVAISFPWTEPGGTAWTDVTITGGPGGSQLKDGVNWNTETPKWFYIYLKNAFTIAQPVATDFLITDYETGETNYTLIGAILSDASTDITPFDQCGRKVIWRKAINILDDASVHDWTDRDCSSAAPASTIMLSLSGRCTCWDNEDHDLGGFLDVVRKGTTLSEPECDLQILAGQQQYATNQSDAVGSRDIATDSSRMIQSRGRQVSGDSLTCNIWVIGYLIR